MNLQKFIISYSRTERLWTFIFHVTFGRFDCTLGNTTISIFMLNHFLFCCFFYVRSVVAKNLRKLPLRLDWPINMKMFHFQHINLKNSADIWLFSYIVLIICPRRAVKFLLLPGQRRTASKVLNFRNGLRGDRISRTLHIYNMSPLRSSCLFKIYRFFLVNRILALIFYRVSINF